MSILELKYLSPKKQGMLPAQRFTCVTSLILTGCPTTMTWIQKWNRKFKMSLYHAIFEHFQCVVFSNSVYSLCSAFEFFSAACFSLHSSLSKGKASWISSAILVFIYKLSGCLSEFLFSSKLNRNKVTITFPSWLWRQVFWEAKTKYKSFIGLWTVNNLFFTNNFSVNVYHLSEIKTPRLPMHAGARV